MEVSNSEMDVDVIPISSHMDAEPEEDNGLRWYHFLIFNNNLPIAFVFATLHVPFTSSIAFATLVVYAYLKHERYLNPWLVDSTALPVDDHLPTYEKWIADGGLKVIAQDNLRDAESCLICRDVLNEPAQIKGCGHVFCRECIGQWHVRGNRS